MSEQNNRLQYLSWGAVALVTVNALQFTSPDIFHTAPYPSTSSSPVNPKPSLDRKSVVYRIEDAGQGGSPWGAVKKSAARSASHIRPATIVESRKKLAEIEQRIATKPIPEDQKKCLAILSSGTELAQELFDAARSLTVKDYGKVGADLRRLVFSARVTEAHLSSGSDYWKVIDAAKKRVDSLMDCAGATSPAKESAQGNIDYLALRTALFSSCAGGSMEQCEADLARKTAKRVLERDMPRMKADERCGGGLEKIDRALGLGWETFPYEVSPNAFKKIDVHSSPISPETLHVLMDWKTQSLHTYGCSFDGIFEEPLYPKRFHPFMGRILLPPRIADGPTL